ncbi:MAG TPA: hypothetical protein VIA06_07705 [Candidatus Dormibacteraeota bacterium]|jgi:hypothetical protein|nr:hypothetical protein [Candidatus Dormibacteraeota bacterium]
MLALLGIRLNPFLMGAIAVVAIALGVLLHRYALDIVGGIVLILALGRLVLQFQDGRSGRGGVVR